ncbi:Acyl-CoA dehydrogenase family member 9, mitochondrial [Strongyloides ratti]|uniref:Acyl-CoA dehydrogenase family member 9, mitochondrial n=1 Tax=Strongyloides ratti TaxID=34506 RepID=A0A090L186_STRRB|nr:Acyl-CoA dehydrogenase family member 9, mitochondrial [Strongyloides ratti]CEF63471.1 Acyl-CoA dehydrogenase family member 9, mitochondrial [Strongyloides ratti]
MKIGLLRKFAIPSKFSNTLYLKSRNYCTSVSSIEPNKKKKEISQIPIKELKAAIDEANISVEKYSLSRGLSLNKFEKDFFIYPEFIETEEVDDLKKYCDKLTNDLKESFRFADDDDKCLPCETIQALLSNEVNRLFVPKAYGGLEYCLKKQIRVFESLGIDLSLYNVVNNSRLAIQLLSIYGTEEQKTKYLHGLSENLIRPAICIYEDDEFDFANMKTEVSGVSHDNYKLNGLKINVINGRTADLFFILAKKKTRDNNVETISCYVISRDDNSDNKIIIQNGSSHIGLQSIDFCDIKFDDINIKEENVLGNEGNGVDIASEIIYRNKLQYAGAVIGFMKNLLQDLSNYCNSTVRGNNRLSDSCSVKKVIGDIAMDIYVLESVTYYIGGLIDENLMILTDIEENVINRLSSKILRNAMKYLGEISGLANAHGLLKKEKICADIITLLSMNNPEMNIIEQISLSTYYTWAKNKNISQTIKKISPLKAIFGANSESNFLNPKPKHFIAEHVHPSLQYACKSLEDTMARLDILMDKVVKEEGKIIENDYHTLQLLANIIESNFIMTACITRASRSYSIGLRNSDLELAWTSFLCSDLEIKNKETMLSLMQYLNVFNINRSFVGIGSSILNSGKYLIESPIEKNW